jgi:hypothetical protein
MINAAFRLPYSSLSYLHDRLLEDSPPITSSELLSEIEWRSQVAASTPGSYDDRSLDPNYMLPPVVSGIQPGTVASFPLRMSHADTYLGEVDPASGKPLRTALVGDAAHTVHPLAGQGLNMGLADVAVLRSTIREAVDLGADIGVLFDQQYPHMVKLSLTVFSFFRISNFITEIPPRAVSGEPRNPLCHRQAPQTVCARGTASRMGPVNGTRGPKRAAVAQGGDHGLRWRLGVVGWWWWWCFSAVAKEARRS